MGLLYGSDLTRYVAPNWLNQGKKRGDVKPIKVRVDLTCEERIPYMIGLGVSDPMWEIFAVKVGGNQAALNATQKQSNASDSVIVSLPTILLRTGRGRRP